MKTGNLEYTRNFYELVNVNNDVTILDYVIKLNTNLSKNSLFTEKIRIEKDNGYHDRSREFEYWLFFRDDTNWKRCTNTGLALTNKKESFVFEGNIPETVILKTKTSKGKDWKNPKHFVIFQFSEDCRTVVIDIFKNFYPHKKELINHIINEHSFVYQYPIPNNKTK